MTCSGRYTLDTDGRINELALENADVHLERLDKHNYSLIITNGQGHWNLNIRDATPFEISIPNWQNPSDWRAP